MQQQNRGPNEKSRKPAKFVGADFSDPKQANDPNFDARVFEDFLDEDVIKKVEDFKQRYLDMKEKAENGSRDVAYAELKLEELIK